MNHIKIKILEELKEHLPFTALATLISMIIAVFFLIKQDFLNYSLSLFYIFHPAHLFFSSIVSTAIFYNYKKKIIQSLLFGVFIALVIGSLSDIIFPYLGSLIFKIPTEFHLPEIESPLLIFGVSIAGAIVGIIFKKTKVPHFLHIFISIFASLLYIFAYSTNFNWLTIFLIFIITIIAVTVPCCLSDIVLPIMFSRDKKAKKEIKELEKKYKLKVREVVVH